MMLFEELLQRHLGEFGRYQKFIFALVCIITIPGAWNNLGIVFLAGVPEHRCSIPELDNGGVPENLIRNLSIPYTTKGYSACSMYDRNYTAYGVNKTDVTSVEVEAIIVADTSAHVIPCTHGWKYSQDVYTSTVTSKVRSTTRKTCAEKWNLVCQKDVLRATASSVYMAGLLIGVLATGVFSDICGRKPCLVVCLVLQVFSNIALAFSPNYTAFTIIRFVIGFCSVGTFTTAFIIALEFVGPSYRVHTGIAIEYPWALGYMLYALIAYGLRDWFVLHLVTTVPMVLLLVALPFIPESPRWLYANNKADKADEIVKKIAKWNKTKLPKPLNITIKQDKTGYIWDILRTPRMRIRSLIIFYIWIVNSLVYYGLSLGTSSMGGDDFVNFFIAGAVEVPAYIFAQVSLTYLGRRLPLAGTMAVGGVSLLCTTFIPIDWVSTTITLAMIGKFCISASFGIIYVHTAEVYPTVVRQAALSSASLCARIGGIAAPYIGLLARFGHFVPLLVFGMVSLSAAGLTLLLPETKNKHLPETMVDGENFGRTDRQVFPKKKSPEVIPGVHSDTLL